MCTNGLDVKEKHMISFEENFFKLFSFYYLVKQICFIN